MFMTQVFNFLDSTNKASACKPLAGIKESTGSPRVEKQVQMLSRLDLITILL